MLAQLAAAMLSFADSSTAPAVRIQPEVQIRVDSVRHELAVTAGHIHIPGGTGYAHEHSYYFEPAGALSK